MACEKEPSTPASRQVGKAKGGGILGIKQRRQAVLPGMTGKTWPSNLTTPAWTKGFSSLIHQSFKTNFFSSRSRPSIIKSYLSKTDSALIAPKASGITLITVLGNNLFKRRWAASTFNRPKSASE